MWTIELLVMVAMIAINSLFAAYEIALASVGVGRLDTLAQERKHGAASALRMKQSMEASLAVVQLGITLVGAVAAATGGAGAEEAIEPTLREWGMTAGWAQFAAIALVVVPLTVVTIIFGELVPKVFALRNKEWVCLTLSPPMEWFSKTVWPAVWGLESSVSLIMAWSERRWSPNAEGARAEDAALQELRAIASLARTSRLIGRREEGIIVSAARLANTPVTGIMLPAQYISMLKLDDTLTDALIAAHHDMHTRFPVTTRPGDPQAIVGYVNFKDIVATLRLSPHDPSIRGILRPLPSCDSAKSVSASLEQLIRDHNHIALVRDKDNTVLGMVTLEDILEELVGEIHDEYDRLPAHLAPSGDGWIVGGNVTLERLRDVAGIELPVEGEHHIHNVSEWVAEQLEHPAHGGEILHAGAVRVVVRKVRRNHVQEALVDREKVETQPNVEPSPAHSS
jgi:putative hemolysin